MESINPEQLHAHLSGYLQPLLNNASAAQRRRFMRSLANRLRNQQAQRIQQQRNPDGSPYAPRKQSRRALFEHIHKKPNLRASVRQHTINVGFYGYLARIARVHQYGEQAEVVPGLSVRYQRRELLGFNRDDIALIEQAAVEYLSGNPER